MKKRPLQHRLKKFQEQSGQTTETQEDRSRVGQVMPVDLRGRASPHGKAGPSIVYAPLSLGFRVRVRVRVRVSADIW